MTFCNAEAVAELLQRANAVQCLMRVLHEAPARALSMHASGDMQCFCRIERS